MAACLPILDFLKILELLVIAFFGLKWSTKFQKDRLNGLKVILFSKTHDNRRHAAAVLDFLKILKLQVVALVGLKWPTNFQKDRSTGLKVIIF
jgi:hypothetical protein